MNLKPISLNYMMHILKRYYVYDDIFNKYNFFFKVNNDYYKIKTIDIMTPCIICENLYTKNFTKLKSVEINDNLFILDFEEPTQVRLKKEYITTEFEKNKFLIWDNSYNYEYISCVYNNEIFYFNKECIEYI